MTDNVTNPSAPSGCVRWLAVLTSLLTLIQAGTAWRTLQTPPELAAVVSIPMPFELVASGIWGLLAAFVTVTLVRRSPRALSYAARLLLGYGVYSLARLALFVRADYDQQRLPLLIALTAFILLIPTAFVLRPLRVAIQPTENSGHGRKSED